jgi:hypothetical protein
LDELRQGLPVEAYFYVAGAEAGSTPVVSWRGRYEGCVEAAAGRHPDGERFRPLSTAGDSSWAGFWHVVDLHPFPEPYRIPIGQLYGWEKEAPYKGNFVPRGPMLITDPEVGG